MYSSQTVQTIAMAMTVTDNYSCTCSTATLPDKRNIFNLRLQSKMREVPPLSPLLSTAESSNKGVFIYIYLHLLKTSAHSFDNRTLKIYLGSKGVW